MLGLGKLGDLNSLMKSAQEMQQKLAEVQERLADMTVVGDSGGGMVRVVANGKQEILSIDIDESLFDDDREMTQDLVVAAVNVALTRAREMAQREMSTVVGNLPPGLGDLGNMMNPGA
jgi:DNA-binding YbaB/EbfC family protein